MVFGTPLKLYIVLCSDQNYHSYFFFKLFAAFRR